MTTDARRLDVYLSLKDRFSKEMGTAERATVRFRNEMRRVAIGLGAFSAVGTLALRSWITQSETTRKSVLELTYTLESVGANATAMGSHLEEMFAHLSKVSGASINSIRNTFVALTRAFGSGAGGEAFAEQTLAAAVALERLTGNKDAASLLAKALEGNADAIEEFRTLTNIDLSTASSTAERLSMAVAGLVPHLVEAKGPFDDLTNEIAGLKTAMGTEFSKTFSVPIKALADVLDQLAANKDLVRIATELTAISVAIGLIAAAGLGLLALDPLVLIIAGIALGIAGVATAIMELERWRKNREAPGVALGEKFSEGLPAFGSKADETRVKYLLSLIREKGGDLSKFSADELRDLTKFQETHPEAVASRELLARIRRAMTGQVTQEGGPPPIPPTPPPWKFYEHPGVTDAEAATAGGGGNDANLGPVVHPGVPVSVTNNYNITSNGDIDFERRVREMLDDMVRRGNFRPGLFQ